jgi:hypothetical protein
MRRNGEAQAYVDCPLSWIGGDMRYRLVVCAYHPLTAKEQSILAAVVGPTSMYQVAGTDAVPSDVSQRASCDVLIVHTTEGGSRDSGSGDDTERGFHDD